MENEVLTILFGHFGYERFQVKSMKGTIMDELLEIRDIQAEEQIGVPSQMGIFLSGLDRQIVQLNNNRRIQFSVMERADGGKPAIYQFARIS